MLLALHHLRNLLPLLLGWVDAGRIVRTGVQEDDGVLRCRLDGRQHAADVERLGLWVEVWVGAEREADISEDLMMVGPGGI